MPRPGYVVAGASIALVVAVLASLGIGARALPPHEVFAALLHNDRSEASVIVHDYRLPRTILGVIVGLALGCAGALTQAVTRNPIADPGILGVSAGAAIGVVCSLALGWTSDLGGYVVAALLGALAASMLVAGVVRFGHSSEPVRLVLAGAAMTAMLSSITGAVLILDHRSLDEYRFWVLGSLSGRGDDGWQVLPLVALGCVLAMALARGLDSTALGRSTAQGLGARVGLINAGALIAIVVLSASATAVAGPITFVGLAAPHLARPFVGARHRWLLPTSALIAAVLLLAADTAGRVLVPGELPAGVVTALVGAPLLIVLSLRTPRTANLVGEPR